MGRGKLQTGLIWAVSAAGVLLWFGAGIDFVHGAPGNATVFVDDERKTYFAPFCVAEPARYRVARIGEVERAYWPDRECRDEGYFVQEGRSLTGRLFETLGLLAPLPSRWNPDGTWNW